MTDKFWPRFVTAAEVGALWGVKLTLALALPLIIVFWLGADYARVREGANMGRAAVEYLNKVIAEQQKAQGAKPATPQTPAPAPAPTPEGGAR